MNMSKEQPNFDIPSEFELFGTTWKVRFIDEPLNYDDLGICEESQGAIYLHVRHSHKEIPPDRLEETFYHELVHAIFHSGAYEELTKNEQLVQFIGACFHQFMKSKKY